MSYTEQAELLIKRWISGEHEQAVLKVFEGHEDKAVLFASTFITLHRRRPVAAHTLMLALMNKAKAL